MLKLVRRMLKDYDRYGIVAAIGWLAVCGGMMGAAIVSVQHLLLALHSSSQLVGGASMFLTAPVVLYFVPTFWACGFLINERLWMLVGIHRLLGWEDNKIRNQIGSLVGEKQ